MTTSALYRDLVQLDPAQHRGKKLRTLDDFSVTRGLHAVYLAAAEFPNAALEFPIIFVDVSPPAEAGAAQTLTAVSPVALLGLVANENLHLAGHRWDAGYLPAFIRRFPYATGPVAGSDRAGVFIDQAWSGLNDTEGDPLFEADDKPAPALLRALEFLQRFDEEAQRTGMFCKRLVELGLLKTMKADGKLPSGKPISVDGFLTVDEDRLKALPDATVLELHRNGMLGLLHLHLVSLGNIRRLMERKAKLDDAADATLPGRASPLKPS